MIDDTELGPLADRAFETWTLRSRGGLSAARSLLELGYEVRGLDVRALGDGRDLIAVVGSKRGDLAVLHVRWPPGGPPAVERVARGIGPGGAPIDVIALSADGRRVAIGTRRHGLYAGDTDTFVEDLGAGRARRLDEGTERWTSLRWDDATGVLLAASENGGLFAWIPGANALEALPTLPGAVTALAIDRGSTPAADQLYVATDAGTLHRAVRGPPTDGHGTVGEFVVTDAPFDERPGTVYLHLIPLSDYHVGAARIWPRHRGVVAVSLLTVRLICKPGEGGHTVGQRFHVPRALKILSAATVSLPGAALTIVCDLQRIAHVLPVELRNGDAETSTGAIFSGLPQQVRLADRAFAMVAVPVPPGSDHALLVVGTGDHHLAVHEVHAADALEARHRAETARIFAPEPTDPVERVRALARSRRFQSSDWNRFFVDLLGQALSRSPPAAGDERWEEVLLELLFTLSWDERLVFDAIDMLARRLAEWSMLPGAGGRALQARARDLVRHLRKFQLDGLSYSDKISRRLELAQANRGHNPNDAIVYCGILAETRVDPLFVRRFEPAEGFGAMSWFTPLIRPAAGDRVHWSHTTAEDPALLLIGTRSRHLWLVDLEGAALRLCLPEDWKVPIGVFFSGADVIVVFSDFRVRSTSRARFVAMWLAHRGAVPELEVPEPEVPELEVADAFVAPAAQPLLEVDATAAAFRPSAVCPLPGEHPNAGGGGLFGDEGGGIWRLDPPSATTAGTFARLHHLPGGAIRELRSSWIADTQGRRVNFVVAATDAGRVHLLRERDDGSLEESDRAQAGASPVRLLQWPDPHALGFVAGAEEGLVQCYRVRWADGLKLAIRWSYRAEASISDLHGWWMEPEVLESYRFFVVTAKRIHVLDPDGHLRDTFSVHADHWPIQKFALAPATRADMADGVACRLFGVGHEDVVFGLRILDRRTRIAAVDREILERGCPATERDLLAWRGARTRESHLRMRYYRYSARYSVDYPTPLLAEMRDLLDRASPERESAGIMHALVQRLFQANVPGTAPSDDAAFGLPWMLADPERLLPVFELVRELRQAWGAEGSDMNRQARRFALRSILRAVRDLDALRQWREVGRAVREAVSETDSMEHREARKLADPALLLQKYLEEEVPFIQYKTLQYLERLLFGWPGTGRLGGHIDPGVLLRRRGDVRADDVEFVLKLLLHRLQMLGVDDLTGERANELAIEVARVLRRLLAERLLHPLYLVRACEDYGIPGGYLDWVAQVYEAHAEEGDRSTLPDLLRAASRLAAFVRGDEGLDAAAARAAVERILEGCDALDGEGPNPFGPQRSARDFLRHVHALLGARKLEDNEAVSGEWKAAGRESVDGACAEVLDTFAALIDAISRYQVRVYVDVNIQEERFQSFSVQDFRAIEQALEAIEGLLGRQPADGSSLTPGDRRLTETLLNHWRRMVEQEREQGLIDGFLQALDLERLTAKTLERDSLRNSSSFDLATTETTLRDHALRNLLARLINFAQADQALMVYLLEPPSGAQVWMATWRLGEGPGSVVMEQRISGDASNPAAPPPWVPEAWCQPATLRGLTRTGIEKALAGIPQASGSSKWDLEVFDGTGESGPEILGWLALGWKDAQAPGRPRFTSHRLLVNLVLSSLTLMHMEVSTKAMQGRFFSMVAHNLRNPIFHFLAGMTVLRKGHLDNQPIEKRRGYYDQFYRQASHMAGIVEGLLKFRGDRITPTLSWVILRDVVDDAVKACRRDFEHQERRLTWSGRTAPDVWWYTDRTRVYEIVQSLLANALKYSDRGREVTVVLSLDPSAQHPGATISVRDEGMGVPPDERHRIFEAYYRARNAASRQGLGLGLYISRLYADALDGRLQYRSNAPAKGSEFTLYLRDLSANAPEDPPEHDPDADPRMGGA